MMEEDRAGVDYHEEGVDVHPYLLAVLLMAMGVPIGLLGFLMLWVL